MQKQTKINDLFFFYIGHEKGKGNKILVPCLVVFRFLKWRQESAKKSLSISVKRWTEIRNC